MKFRHHLHMFLMCKVQWPKGPLLDFVWWLGQGD